MDKEDMMVSCWWFKFCTEALMKEFVRRLKMCDERKRWLDVGGLNFVRRL